MRRRYRWDPKLNKWVEFKRDRSGIIIMGDLPDFISPVTGEVIHGRAGMREHMKRHDLAHMDDFKNEWAEAAKKREKFFTDQSGDRDRAMDIARALEKHSSR